MLDPWIIEEIRKREEEQKRDDRPRIEIPREVPPPRPEHEGRQPDEGDDESRGVVIIEL